MTNTEKETPTSHNSFVDTSEASNEQALPQQTIVQSWSTSEDAAFIIFIKNMCLEYEKHVLKENPHIANYVLTNEDKDKIRRYEGRYGSKNNFKDRIDVISNLLHTTSMLPSPRGYNTPIQNILELELAKRDFDSMFNDELS